MWLPSDAAACSRARDAAAARLRRLGLRSAPPHVADASSRARRRASQGSKCAAFGTSLEAAPSRTVACCAGALGLQVPRLVCDACDAIRAQARVEGLFRKAGSQSRQKEMKRILDSGGKFDSSCHVIDVAGLLKLYLRSLPEPLIGEDLQDLLLRCTLLPEDRRVEALNLSLLFMPVSHLHLLHYITEFLHFIASESEHNKMDSKNLAVIMVPSIMPLPLACTPQRLERHIELVKYFIDNANTIGTVPDELLTMKSDDEREKKKKKRRSGSLTRMFTGLKKMVSNTVNKTASIENLATPVMDKSAKKREADHVFSAKKRKEIIETIPLNSLALTPRFSNAKEYKRLRLSIGHKSKEKLIQESVVLRKHSRSSYDFMDGKSSTDDHASENKAFNAKLDNKDSDYVRIPKSEYEEIKNRVSAIENQISKEFHAMTSADEPVRQVQTAYEKTLEEAAVLSSPGAEQLARRLSKELKIRQPSENKIIRSPSARKIGTIKRRSRENVTKLIRTQTWSSSSPIALQHSNIVNKPSQLYNNNNNNGGLRRGRPNTVNTGLTIPSFPNPNASDGTISENKVEGVVSREEPSAITDDSSNVRLDFQRAKRPSSFHGIADVNKSIKIVNDSQSQSRMPPSNSGPWLDARKYLLRCEDLANPLTGRESVVKLRSQMAGTVMARAKLFDALTDSDSSLEKPVNRRTSRASNGFARKSRKNTTESFDLNAPDVEKTLRKPVYKSPGYVSKKHRPRPPIKSPILCAKNPLNLSTQLKDVIYDVCTPLSEKLTSHTKNPTLAKIVESAKAKSPRAIPQLKKSLHVKQVGGFKTPTTMEQIKRVNTPVRVNHNTTPRRQSPRLLSMKARQLNNY